MRHLLALCIAILCMSMASVPDTQKPRREEAKATCAKHTDHDIQWQDGFTDSDSLIMPYS